MTSPLRVGWLSWVIMGLAIAIAKPACDHKARGVVLIHGGLITGSNWLSDSQGQTGYVFPVRLSQIRSKFDSVSQITSLTL